MKSLFNRYLWVVQACLALFGLLFIVLSSVPALAPGGSIRSSALLSIGVTVLVTALYTIFQSVSGTDVASTIENKLEFQRHLYDIGLERIHLGIGDETIFDRFEIAHTIDMMYNTAKNCSYRYGNRIENAIAKRGCRVRILIADPENDVFQRSAISAALCPGTAISSELKDVVSHLELLLNRLEQRLPRLNAGSLEVRLYPCIPTSSIVIVDNEIVRHTPYLPYKHSSEVPIYDVTRERGGDLFDLYSNVFEDVWKRSRSILRVNFSDAERSVNVLDVQSSTPSRQ